MNSSPPSHRLDEIKLPRSWLLKEVQSLLATSPHLIVTGLRRSGKSRLLDRLQSGPDTLQKPGLVLRHSCAAETDHSTDSVASFLLDISDQLDSLEPGGRAPDTPANQHHDGSGNSRRWASFVLPRLRSVVAQHRTSGSFVYVLIDGLDQDHWRTDSGRLLHFIRDEVRPPAGLRLIMCCRSHEHVGITQLQAALPLAVLDLSSPKFAVNWRSDLIAFADEARRLDIDVPPADVVGRKETITPDFTAISAYLLRDVDPASRPSDSTDYRLVQDVNACLESVPGARLGPIAQRALVLAAATTGGIARETARGMLMCDDRDFDDALGYLEAFVVSEDGRFELRDQHYAVEILALNRGIDAHMMVTNYAIRLARAPGNVLSDPYLFAKALYHATYAEALGEDAQAELTGVRNAIGAALIEGDLVHGPAVYAAATESYLRSLFSRPAWRDTAVPLTVGLLASRHQPVLDRVAVVCPELASSAGAEVQVALLRALRNSSYSAAVGLYARILPNFRHREDQSEELWRAATHGRRKRRSALASQLGRDWPRAGGVDARAGTALLSAASNRIGIGSPLATMRFGLFAADVTIGSWIASPLDETEIEASSTFWETVLIDELKLPDRANRISMPVARTFGRQIGVRSAAALKAVGLEIGSVPIRDKEQIHRLLALPGQEPDLHGDVLAALEGAGAWPAFVWGCLVASAAHIDPQRYVETLAHVVSEDGVSEAVLYYTLASGLAVPDSARELGSASLEALLERYWATADESDVTRDAAVPAAAAVALSAASSHAAPPILSMALSGDLRPRARDEAMEAIAALVSLDPQRGYPLLGRLAHAAPVGVYEEIIGRCDPAKGQRLREVTRYAVAAALALSHFPRLRKSLFAPAVELAASARSEDEWADRMPEAFVAEVMREGFHIGRLFGFERAT